jgi:hypothetical protein
MREPELQSAAADPPELAGIDLPRPRRSDFDDGENDPPVHLSAKYAQSSHRSIAKLCDLQRQSSK